MPNDAMGNSLGSIFGSFLRPRQGTTSTQPKPRPGTGPGDATPREQSDYYSNLGGGSNEQRFQQGFERSFQGATEEGFRTRDIEDQRIDEARAYRGNIDQIMEDPLSQGDIQDLYGGMLNDVARMKMRDMEALGEFTGQTGIRGNAMADLFATAENEAFSSVSRGMADLRSHMADMTAQHKITQLNATLAGAQLAALPPSMLGLNTLIQGMETSAGAWGAEREYQAALKAAESQKESSIFGGLLGVAGSLLSGGLF